MPVHFSVAPLFRGHTAPTDVAVGSASSTSLAGSTSQPAWPGDRLELPVTARDAGLNRDGSALRLHHKAKPTNTLTLDEIVVAPEQRREELLRRFRDLLASKAGVSEGLDPAAARLSIQDGPWRIEVSAGVIRVVAQLDDTERYELTIDATTPTRPQVTLDPPSAERGAALALLLDAFDHLLCKPVHLARRIDPKASQLFELLLGPGGIMNPQDRQLLPAGQRFRNPKLIAWDFNGTVGDGRGSFRPDLRDVTDNLNRMGAMSVITTTIDPQPIERLLAQANIHFNAFFGGREVRDYPKNKHYQVLAEAYGFEADATRARMVVIGDSKTDIPSDLPGVLFINNDDQTPAEVIQLLLHRLDELGDGDFALGLERAGAADLMPGERRTIEMSPISFSVELRDGSNGDTPSLVPTLHDVRVHLNDVELVTLLATAPDPADLDQRARHELGFRFIECILPEERLAGLLRQLADVPEKRSLIAAGQVRLEERRALVQSARGLAQRLLTEPDQMPFERLLGLTEALAEVGDSEVSDQLAELVDHFPQLNRAAAATARAELVDDRATLTALLARARIITPASGRPGAGDPSIGATTEAEYFGRDARALVKLLTRAAASPLSSSDKARGRLLAAMDEFLEKPFPGLDDLFVEMEQQLDASFAEAEASLDELFTERGARAVELAEPATEAIRLASIKERRWTEVKVAWDGLVAAT